MTRRRLSRCLLLTALLSAGPRPAVAQLLPAGSTATKLVTGYQFTESPLYDGNGGVLFVDLNGNKIERYDIAAGTAAVVDPASGGANGMYFDAGGHIVVAERGRRDIERRSTSNITQVDAVLASTYNGKQLNDPNDLVIDSAGGIYFTDPDYSNRRSLPDGVYYLSPGGTLTQLFTKFNKPNGVILSPNGNTLYLAIQQEFRIMAYDVGPGGALTNERQFVKTNVDAGGNPLSGITNGPDGITIDPSGNVYAAVQNAVFAWDPAGQRLFSLPVGEQPTNVELGGHNGKTLYITAGKSLYGVPLNVVPKLPGDFDYDGDVDAADLTVCLAAHGQTGAALDADANGDGAADGADFLAWQQNLNVAGDGGSLKAATAPLGVPEPAALVLAALAGLNFWFWPHLRSTAR